MTRAFAEIIREYGPFEGVDEVHGVTFDGEHVWFASGDRLHALDPVSGRTTRTLNVAAHAGTAFDGRHLYQLAEDRIQRIDPATGEVISTVPAPANGAVSGMAWAEGVLWIGEFGGRRIHEVDPETGAVLRTLESNRRVTGVSWVDGELWHATLESGLSELRRIDTGTGKVLQQVDMPPGVTVSGLESDGADGFYCGGSTSGTVRAVRRPRRA